MQSRFETAKCSLILAKTQKMQMKIELEDCAWTLWIDGCRDWGL